MNGQEGAMNVAERLAGARVRYSGEFQLAKLRNPGCTDGHAHQIAIEATADEITVLEAKLDIELANLKAEMRVKYSGGR